MSLTMTLKPRLSEKAYNQSQSSNVYVFQVPEDANKLTVAQAVEAQFGVKVLTVNIMITKGKIKQSYRKRGGKVAGSRNDVKKAYVTVKQGDSIPVFAAEEDQKPASKAKKGTK